MVVGYVVRTFAAAALAVATRKSTSIPDASNRRRRVVVSRTEVICTHAAGKPAIPATAALKESRRSAVNSAFESERLTESSTKVGVAGMAGSGAGVVVCAAAVVSAPAVGLDVVASAAVVVCGGAVSASVVVCEGVVSAKAGVVVVDALRAIVVGC